MTIYNANKRVNGTFATSNFGKRSNHQKTVGNNSLTSMSLSKDNID